MKEEKFYEKTYFVIGTCSFHGSDVPRGMRRWWRNAATTAAAGGETTAAASEAATEAASTDDSNLSDVEKIIKEAEGMSMEELAKKAIEESNGKTFYGVGNSSRGKSALPLFIEYLQSIDPSYKWNMSGSSRRTTRSLSS